MRKRLLILNLLLLGAMGVSGCVMYNGVPQEEVVESPIKLELSTSSMDLIVGDGGKTFSVKVSSEEEEIKDNKVSISNSNKEVVELDAEEVESEAKVRVKGLKDGDATLTITSNQDKNAKATLKVKVSSGDGTFRVESVTITNKPITLKEGETKKIEYTISPENASNKDVTFTSADTTYVTVDSSGVVTAVKATIEPVKVFVESKDTDAKDFTLVTVEADTTLIENNYYLIGSSEEFGEWNKANIKKKYELTKNPGNDNEYMVKFEANAGDEVKVVRYHKDSDLEWFKADSGYSGTSLCYGDGTCASVTDNEFKNIRINTSGKYTIYFDTSVMSGDIVKYYVGPWAN